MKEAQVGREEVKIVREEEIKISREDGEWNYFVDALSKKGYNMDSGISFQGTSEWGIYRKGASEKVAILELGKNKNEPGVFTILDTGNAESLRRDVYQILNIDVNRVDIHKAIKGFTRENDFTITKSRRPDGMEKPGEEFSLISETDIKVRFVPTSNGYRMDLEDGFNLTKAKAFLDQIEEKMKNSSKIPADMRDNIIKETILANVKEGLTVEEAFEIKEIGKVFSRNVKIDVDKGQITFNNETVSFKATDVDKLKIKKNLSIQ